MKDAVLQPEVGGHLEEDVLVDEPVVDFVIQVNVVDMPYYEALSKESKEKLHMQFNADFEYFVCSRHLKEFGFNRITNKQ